MQRGEQGEVGESSEVHTVVCAIHGPPFALAADPRVARAQIPREVLQAEVAHPCRLRRLPRLDVAPRIGPQLRPRHRAARGQAPAPRRRFPSPSVDVAPVRRAAEVRHRGVHPHYSQPEPRGRPGSERRQRDGKRVHLLDVRGLGAKPQPSVQGRLQRGEGKGVGAQEYVLGFIIQGILGLG